MSLRPPEDETIESKIAGASREVDRIRRLAYYERRHLPDLVDALCELAKFRSRKGERGRAERLYREALTHCESVAAPLPPELLFRVHALLGYHFDGLGQAGQAREHYQKAILAAERCRALEPAQIGVIQNNLAMLAKNEGRRDQAEAHYLLALEYFSRGGEGEANPRVAAVHNNLGVLYYSRRQFDKARESHERALALRRRIYGEEGTHVDLGQSYNNLAALFKAMGDEDRAADCLARVDAIGTRLPAEPPGREA